MASPTFQKALESYTGGLALDDTVALLDRQTAVLERIAAGAPLDEVLTEVVTAFEDLVPRSRCSVLLLDTDSATLHHAAAPSLPADYSAEIDGLVIGANAGACGAAAHFGIPIITEDIAEDPRWVSFLAAAERAGLRACWSTPIRGRAGVLGTFAVYRDEPHRPSPREKRLVDQLTHVASVAIDHDRLLAERRHRHEAEVARRAAEVASKAKTDFISALGHELRTPLQAITGFTELLGKLDLSAERRHAALEHIDSACRHILSLVDEVLDVSRIEAGVLSLHPAKVDIDAVVAEVVALLEPLAEAERVTVHRVGRAGSVVADPRRVTQVLLNIVGNAIRYNHEGGSVRVEMLRSGDDVVVAVRDTGQGIAEEHRDRLFTPFDRLGADRDQGVGLGLPLARGLAEAMNGTLDVASTPGEGTTVVVTLPARCASLENPLRPM